MPPLVPQNHSPLAVLTIISSLFKSKLLAKIIAYIAEIANAEEDDAPEAGGIEEETYKLNPNLISCCILV